MSKDYIQSTVDKIQKSITNAFMMGVENGNAEKALDPRRIDAIKETMHKLCKLEQDFQVENAFAQTFQCQSLENFDVEYKRQFAEEAQKNDTGESQRYLKFMTDLEDVQSAVNRTSCADSQIDQSVDINGISVQSLTTLFIDPITKNPIKNPVRNKNCKHIYDEESIMQAIQINERVRCPYVGCTVKKVLASDLMEDRELKQKILGIQMESQNATNY